MNAITHFFWNYINAGKERFYAEDPRVPFVNGFTLILLAILVPFGVHRILTGGLVPGLVNFAVALFLIANVVYLRKTLWVSLASFGLSLIVVLLATYVFYEGATGGDTGILWIFPIPTLIFFLSGKQSAVNWSLFLALLILAVGSLFLFGHLHSPYSATQLLVALFPFAAIVGGLYMYAKFTEWNAQELEERTKSLREGFEKEKNIIKTESTQREEFLRSRLNAFFDTTDDLMGIADLNEGKFIEVNPAFINAFGVTKEELCSKKFREFLQPEEIPKAQTVQESLKKGQLVKNLLLRGQKKGGDPFWIMWSATANKDNVYVTGRIVDDLIIAQKQTEEKMKEIEELNKLMVGREVRMTELKEEIAELKQRLGEK